MKAQRWIFASGLYFLCVRPPLPTTDEPRNQPAQAAAASAERGTSYVDIPLWIARLLLFPPTTVTSSAIVPVSVFLGNFGFRCLKSSAAERGRGGAAAAAGIVCNCTYPGAWSRWLYVVLFLGRHASHYDQFCRPMEFTSWTFDGHKTKSQTKLNCSKKERNVVVLPIAGFNGQKHTFCITYHRINLKLISYYWRDKKKKTCRP